jgi:outer membrane receptor protein involved in Fe transport
MHCSFLRAAASLASVAVAICQPATAQAQVRSFHVVAQPASSGVREFAKQAGIQVTITGRDGETHKVNAVTGDLDVRDALDRLLSGTGLTVSSFDGKAAILGEESVADGDEGIVVTGSRIARRELKSAMPISITNFEDAADLGHFTALGALMQEPAVVMGFGPNANNRDNAGLQSINLRNMGTNRSLTLIDGRRRVSSNGASSEINLATIPMAMIERTEIVTGGAAAIYGADAVTGAINIVTKKDIQGLKLTAYQGISDYGDGAQTNLSAAGGLKFANGRGHFVFGGTYSNSHKVTFTDRPWTEHRLNFMANPTPTPGSPSILLNRDTATPFTSQHPTFYLASENKFYSYYDGGMIQIPTGKNYGSGTEFDYFDGIPANLVRNYQDTDFLITPERTYSAIAKFDYDLTDTITYSARFDYGRVKSSGSPQPLREDSRTSYRNGARGPTAYLDNPYMPGVMRDFLVSRGLTSVYIDRFYDNWPWRETHADRENYTISQNLSGSIGAALNWEAYYQYGHSRTEITQANFFRTSRWLAARDVVADPVTGNPVCRDVAAREAGCTPVNIFDDTNPLSAEQLAWLSYDRHRYQYNEQTVFGGSLNGKLFTLPAGDASFAFGAERRTEWVKTVEDPLALSGEAVEIGYNGVTQNVEGRSAVAELYGELVVPLLKDLPFIHSLEAEGAYRWSDYRGSGSTSTWKIGGTWSPVEGLALRGVRSRSVRVPNLGELYAPIAQSTAAGFADPCIAAYQTTATRVANCQALGISTPLGFYSDPVFQQNGGNPNLKPETSNSFTIGAVVNPNFARNFDVTVDYWNINIADVITTVSPTDTMNFCVDLPSIDNVFCRNIQRDPTTKKLTFISSQLVNAAKLKANGVDIGARYKVYLGEGQISFNVKGTYLLGRQTQSIAGQPSSIVKAAGGYTDPRFRGSLQIAYDLDRFAVSLETTFISASKYDPNKPDGYYEVNHVPAYVYNNVFVSHQITPDFNIGFGVRNIANTKPPMLPDLYSGANGRYDTMGRYLFIKVEKSI